MIDERVQTIMNRLAVLGYRPTNTRVAIAQAIAVRSHPFTTQELVDALEAQPVRRATVFRAPRRHRPTFATSASLPV